MLKTVDSFVLGAVVAKHAVDVGHAPNKPNVSNKNSHAQQAINNIPGYRGAVVFAHQCVGDKRGCHNEQHNAQHNA